jgi:hypothetical protein
MRAGSDREQRLVLNTLRFLNGSTATFNWREVHPALKCDRGGIA